MGDWGRRGDVGSRGRTGSERRAVTNAGGPESPPHEGDGQIALLLELMGEINRGAGMEGVFRCVGDSLRRIFGVDRYAVSLVGDDGLPHIVASQGISAEYVARVNATLPETPGMRVIRTRRPLYLLDAPNSEEFAPFQDAAAMEGFRTVLFFPLYSGEKPLGFLVLYHNTIRPYAAEDLALAQVLATQAGVAMAQARLLAELDERRRALERQHEERLAESLAIDRITLRIASSLDLEGTFGTIVETARELTRAASSALYLQVMPEEFEAVAASGADLQVLRKTRLSSRTGLLARMTATREPAQVVDFTRQVSNVSRFQREYVEEHGVHATLGVPLVANGELTGALYVGRTSDEPFSDDAIHMLRRLAAFAQVAVTNAERFSSVQGERSRLQAYLDAIPEGVTVFDRDGAIVLTNAALQRDLHLPTPYAASERERIPSSRGRFGAPAARFRYDQRAVFDRVLRSGESEQGLLDVGDPPRQFEAHYSAIGAPGGETLGVVCTMRDITTPLELERERARTHLLAELLDLSAHLNSQLSIPVLIERVVEAAMQLLGATAGTIGLVEGDELVFRRYHLPQGWTDFDVRLRRGEGAPGHVWESAKPYIANDTPADRHVLQSVRRRLGFKRLVFVPVFDRGGTVIGTLGVYDPRVDREFGQADVEAMQLLAHQAAISIENARLAEMKDEFLSIVSHELKTPVTSIKGFTQILQRRLPADVTDSSGRYLEVINHQADRLTGLINDLLDLSRIQTGRFVFERAPVDLGDLVRDVVSEARLVSPGNDVTYTGPDHLMVLGNGDRLHQVLVNLIDNGIAHGPPKGGIHVTLEATSSVAQVYVCDEGPGLPESERERIFAQYYQVRHGGEKQARGLGLGLFISRRIVEEHGGTIWLDDTDHTSFCFTVPLSADPVPGGATA